jgi:hypothetical protein
MRNEGTAGREVRYQLNLSFEDLRGNAAQTVLRDVMSTTSSATDTQLRPFSDPH